MKYTVTNKKKKITGCIFKIVKQKEESHRQKEYTLDDPIHISRIGKLLYGDRNVTVVSSGSKMMEDLLGRR